MSLAKRAPPVLARRHALRVALPLAVFGLCVPLQVGRAAEKPSAQADVIVAELIAALKDDPSEARRFAARTLQNLGPRAKAAVPALAEMAEHDRANQEIAKSAIRAIEQTPVKITAEDIERWFVELEDAKTGWPRRWRP